MFLSGAALSGSLPEWAYTDQNQQGGWGAIVGSDSIPPLNYPYAECAIGTRQSPMPVSSKALKVPISAIQIDWKPFHADFFNPGHLLQVQPVDPMDDAGQLTVGHDQYSLVQLHIHTPSEHQLDGRTYDAEVHYVHFRPNGMIAVMALFLEVGTQNPALELMLQNEPNTPGDPTHHPTTVLFDPKAFLPNQTVSKSGNMISRYFSYEGSLTTPPCTEGVAWYVLSKPGQISASQLNQLRGFFVNNTRALQAPNGRVNLSLLSEDFTDWKALRVYSPN